MNDNPLLAHLLRKSGPPPLWLTALFGLAVIGWAVLSLVPDLSAMLGQGAAMPDTHAAIFFGSLLLQLGTPVTLAVNAAVFTANSAQPEKLKAARLTSLTRRQLMWGYALAALHRLRVLVALAAGSAPVFVIGSTEFALTFYRIAHPLCSSEPCSDLLAAPVFATARVLVVNSLVAVGMLGLTLLAAAFGAWMGLALGRSGPAVGASVAGMAGMIVVFLALLGPSGNIPIPLAVTIMMAPYVLAAGILALAGREPADTRRG